MAVTFQFPNTFDNIQSIATLIGDFWTNIYGGSKLILDYAKGCMLSEQQLYNDILEVVSTLDNKTCPIFHTANWYNVQIFQSQGVAGTNYTVSFPIPSTLKNAGYLANDVYFPKAMLANGVDYTLDTINNKITFLLNPFNNSAFKQIPVITNGAVTDQRIDLWFFKAQLDWQFLYQQFGYVFGLPSVSSQRYKDFINALWRATTQGTGASDIALAIAAATDASSALNDGETVKVVSADATSVLVITDQNVYRFASTATPIVVVGQIVNKTDQLTDVVQIIRPNNGVVPAGLASLQVPSSFFDPSVTGPLTWSNSSQPLTVQTNVSGFTKVSWPLTGAAGDVANFFSAMHTKGVAAGKTLANYLDLRPGPQVTQPTALNLPTVINPLQFLLQNVFRDNAVIVIIKTAKLGPDALGTGYLSYLRHIQVPHTAMITVLQ